MTMTLLSPGPVYTLAVGQVYALPGLACYVFSDTDVIVSNDPNMTTGTTALTSSTTGGQITAASFIATASTTSESIVSIKI